MHKLLLLLRKDWMSITTTSRSFLILLVIAWLPIMLFSPSAMPFIFLITAYVLIVTLFSLEENDLVCNVVAVLPIRKRDAVIARYLYMYLVLGAELLLCIVIAPLAGMLLNRSELRAGSPAELLTQCLLPTLVSLGGCLLMFSIILPLAYQFGHTRMRMVILVIYIFVFMLTGSLPPVLSALPVLPSGGMASLPILFGMAGGCVLLSLLSLAVSIRVVR